MKNSMYRALLVLASVAATGAATDSVVAGGATTASPVQSGFGVVDFANAKAMPLPRPAAAPNLAKRANVPAVAFGAAGVSAGGQGNGIQIPIHLAGPKFTGELGAIPEQFGTANIPFTTARVNALGDNAQVFYPFRAAGKLFFKINGSTFVCTASLIKPGVIVTAAHCVANFGAQQFYSGWLFVPAFEINIAPYGGYTAQTAVVLTSYLNGTDPCAQSGVICQDDVAVIRLNTLGGLFPGQRVGWLGYGWNGLGFTSSSQALITQLGYPDALDSGQAMERTDSQGQTIPSLSNNTVIGSGRIERWPVGGQPRRST